MGLQQINCNSSGLFLGSIFFILGMMQKRSNMMQDIFAKYFIDPTIKNNWNNIKGVFEVHITQTIMPTGCTPSKPDSQLDGGFNPITASKFPGDYASMYEQANDLNLLLNPDDMVYYFDDTIDSDQNIEASMKWDMLITAYMVLKNMEGVISLIFETIKPTYRSVGSTYLTPAQLWFFMDEYAHGLLFEADSMRMIPWSTIDQFKTNDPNNLGVLDVILQYDYNELWYIDIPQISFDDATEIFTVPNGDDFITLSPSTGEPFWVQPSFVSESVISPSVEATCSFDSPNKYSGRTVEYTLILNDASYGIITVSYKRLILTF